MKSTGKTRGFTIVEMLTVMGIIAILIGLLIPALAQVRDYSNRIQQKAQFHSIDVALEMFKNEFGEYPQSNDCLDVYNPANDKPDPITGTWHYTGANKLAEAMVGLDLLGFHPNSEFRPSGTNTVIDKAGVKIPDTQIYAGYPGYIATTWQTTDENLKSRKGPLCDLENANAYRMNEVYSATHLTGSLFNPLSLVLCDVYAATRSAIGNKKTGTPILYFRARTIYTQQLYNDAAAINDDIYYYPDNEALLSLGSVTNNTINHFLRDNGGSSGADLLDFQNMTLNKQITTIYRPYRAGSYFLVSAGKDGLFGSGDDIFNFEKGSEQ